MVVAGKPSRAHAQKPRSVSRVFPLAGRIRSTLKLGVGTYRAPLPRRQIKLPPNPTETEPAPRSAEERMPSLPPQTSVHLGAPPVGSGSLFATRPCQGPAFRTSFAPSRSRECYSGTLRIAR